MARALRAFLPYQVADHFQHDPSATKARRNNTFERKTIEIRHIGSTREPQDRPDCPYDPERSPHSAAQPNDRKCIAVAIDDIAQVTIATNLVIASLQSEAIIGT